MSEGDQISRVKNGFLETGEDLKGKKNLRVSNQNLMLRHFFRNFLSDLRFAKKGNYDLCIFVILFFLNSFGHLLGCWVT